MTVQITKWFMLGTTIIILGYDLYVATNQAKGDTISEISLKYGWDWATIPFLWGIVVGHLFWPSKNVVYKWARLIGLWVVVALVAFADYLDLYNMVPIFPLVAGIIAGAALWPQKTSVYRGV